MNPEDVKSELTQRLVARQHNRSVSPTRLRLKRKNAVGNTTPHHAGSTDYAEGGNFLLGKLQPRSDSPGAHSPPSKPSVNRVQVSNAPTQGAKIQSHAGAAPSQLAKLPLRPAWPAGVFKTEYLRLKKVDTCRTIESLKKFPNTKDFVYLQRVDRNPSEYNPYALKVVSFSDINPEDFFTLSVNGITFYRNRISEDFTVLVRWERELRLFKDLKKLHLWKHFRMWKAFRLWRKAVRGAKFARCKAALTSSLFILSPVFQKALLHFSGMCCQIRDKLLLRAIPDRPACFGDFLQHQEQHLEVCRDELEAVAEDALTCVTDTCKVSLAELEKELAEFHKKQDVEPQEDSRGGLVKRVAEAEKSSAQNDFAYTMFAATRSRRRALIRFVRMADLMLASALRSVLMASCQSVVHMLQDRQNGEPGHLSDGESSVPLPLFQLDMSLADDCLSLLLSPAEDEFVEGVGVIMEGFVEVCSVVDRMLENEDLVCTVIEEEGLEVQMAMRDLVLDEDFEEHRSTASGLLAGAYQDVVTFTSKYNPFRAMLIEDMALDIKDLESQYRSAVLADKQPHTAEVEEAAAMPAPADDEVEGEAQEAAKVTIETFEAAMERLQDQQTQMQALGDFEDVAVMRLSVSEMKNSMLPVPQACLADLKAMLPRLAFEVFTEFITEVRHATHALTVPDSDVDKFVEKLGFLKVVKEREAKLDALGLEVGNLYEVIKGAGIVVPDFEAAELAALSGDYDALKNAVEEVEGARDENTGRFVAELERDWEEMQKAVVDIRNDAQHEMILDASTEHERVVQFLQELRGRVSTARGENERINRLFAEFKQAAVVSEELDATADEVELKLALWESTAEFAGTVASWSQTPLGELALKAVEEETAKTHKLATKLERALPPNNKVPQLREAVDGMRGVLPVVSALCNGAMRERHWVKVDSAVGEAVPRRDDSALTIEYLVEHKAVAHREAIAAASTEATQEAALEDMLAKVSGKWADIEFTCMQYKDSKDMVILSAIDEVTAALEDSMVTMSTIVSSRFVAGIKTEVEKVEKMLLLFGETLDEWLAVQKNWMYLESIFGAPDIQRQLPGPAKAFQVVDKEFRAIMRAVKERPLALAAGTNPAYLATFQKANESLEQIQKELSDYLAMKRAAFARFYFLGDDELLEILAQSKNAHAVQPHMSKCFDGIKALEFGDDPGAVSITAMLSAEGERVPLGGNLKARGGVEVWLAATEQEMQRALARCTKDALKTYETQDRPAWILEQPAQLAIVVSQMYWAVEVVKALRAGGSAMHEYHQVCLKQLSNLTRLVRGQLSKLHRKLVSALITIDVHARDIVNDLAVKGISSEYEFDWQMQLRYVWDAGIGDMFINQVNTQFQYAYEYLGAQSRLVVTPMTDRCYMTLTGALHLKLGGAPAGPAGTGKTETTKDLGKALGVNCVVFNCGDNLDYKFMGKFFAGVAQSGAWACFDEFNRIDIEVLSVVAQQFLSIVNALKAGVKRFMFEGREIRLIHTCGVFITMNPGYAGRTELPDNLKALFRPMAMMIPDYALVAEVMLFSEGFEDSRTLSRKMVKLYKLSSEQLSQQDHYDFGMRALKSVLVMAGALKRAQPDVPEDQVLIQAMRDSNLPKFLRDDAELFQDIISDLFPNVEVPQQEHAQLQEAIKGHLQDHKLQSPETFVRKVLQLFETLNVRFGVMTVGSTGSGKTTILRTLAGALTTMRTKFAVKDPEFQATHVHTFNPKCIRMGELYGEYNLLTNEWTDGLGSSLIRSAVADTTPDKKYICFDGPVDAIWIENMNTVLDDNCVLCLPNGERIKLNPTTMRMLFEVQDLAVASPATVSRCGMVYVPLEELGWRPFVQTWLDTAMGEVISEVRDHLWQLFDSLVQPLLDWVRQNGREYFKSVDVNLVTTMARIIQSLVSSHEKAIFKGNQEMDGIKANISKIFTFALVWGAGGNMIHDVHEAFDEYARSLLSSTCHLPASGSLFDIFVDMTTTPVDLRSWSDFIPPFHYDKTLSFHSIMVPTLDTTRSRSRALVMNCSIFRFSHLMDICLHVDRSVLFTGETGVGKTVIARSALDNLARTAGFVPYTINFSAQTGAKDTQLLIESKLSKKRKTRFGAPPGSRIVFFVDDLNMPAKEEYGAQPPVELLRQFQDFRGFYDRDKLFWKEVEDVTLCAACGPPGGGRQEVTPRLLRHFTMLCVPPPSGTSTRAIFSAILQGFLGDFGAELQQLAGPMVKASVALYEQVALELLPTPAKSHYTFNLRDLAKVFQGVLMVLPANCKEADGLLRLWVHECCRVFHDRLIDRPDKEQFKEMMVALINQNYTTSSSYAELFEERTIMFGDFLKMGLDMDERRYEEVPSLEKAVAVMGDYLADYNSVKSSAMSIVFFQDAVEHIARMCRVLRQPRGNALLVGVGGSGKSSVSRFAAHMGGFECFSIEPGRSYGLNEFREDIKKLYIQAGIEGKCTVFLFSDTQIVCESFLEDINNMLNSGDVPGMFAQDEKDRVAADIRDWAHEHGYASSKEACYTAFIDRVRENLHIVLTMSPVGESFRNRCRQFPSLINCCTIDWYTQWPQEALLSVSTQLLSNTDLGSDEAKQAVCELCVDVHMSVTAVADKFFSELRRRYYTTPKSFLDLIQLYCALLAEKRQDMNEARERLLVGLQKLSETNAVVDRMKVELGELQPILDQKSEATAQLLETVTADREEASKVQQVVEKDAAEVKAFQQEVQAIADDAKADLAEALPVLESAVKSLNALNKSDIVEMKSFSKPPPLVMLTMEAVCTLRQEKPDWDTAKRMLGDTNFMEALKTFDKENIPDVVIKKLKKYVDNPDFTPEVVAKQSNAAKSLCIWVHAMDKFHIVNKVVEPKKAKLAQAESELEEANAKLKEKQDALQGVMDRVASLVAQLEQAQQEQQDLNDQAELTKARLVRAEKLQNALGDEGVRWTQTAEEIGTAIELLVGDVFVSAAVISYQGAFTAPYRRELCEQWAARCAEKQVPITEGVTVRQTLGSPVEIREWNIFGLPTDDVSVDNGIMVKYGYRWPLMIDPQAQACTWVKNLEAKNGLRVLKQTDNNFLRMLESSIRVGNPVLLEDVGEVLDPSLEPLLTKAIATSGGRSVIRLGDADVDYDPNFRFYITTKLTNPHYLPDVCIKVTVINFTVTMKGLEDQLLGDVVRMERPDLEEQKDNLVLNISADKKQLTELESKILRMLKESKGNILDDSDLINTLNNSKVTSGMIKGRVKEAETTEKTINDTREMYRPAAIRGSTLYFVMADLSMVSPMYQNSLTFFSRLFGYSIENSARDDDVAARVANICSYATTFIYSTVQRGLFADHKLIFSFLLATAILRHPSDRQISAQEWNFFLRGDSAVEDAGPPPAKWLSQSSWNEVVFLDATMPGLQGIKDSLSTDGGWNEWGGSEAPQDRTLPSGWDDKITKFQRLMLLKVLRQEKVCAGIARYVGELHGPSFQFPPPWRLEEVYPDTNCRTPIVFVLSTGADPTALLQRFAEGMGWTPGERLHMVSLGQGQGPIAENMIDQARKSGDWVCLQNCHVASSWMLQLESIVEDLGKPASAVHEDFRLWLTSMPTKIFPVQVLQNSTKLTNEPPYGVRANVGSTFADIAETDFESVEAKPLPWKKLVFSLAFFHAVIQERRKFGPIGWNIRYDFNQSDFECSMSTVRMFLLDGAAIPWDAMEFVVGQINYGGRVTDDNDRRCLMAILRQYILPGVLDPAYTFTPSGKYFSPAAAETPLEAVREYVRQLPAADAPEVFGMHANASIQSQLQETNSLVQTIVAIQPRVAGAAGGESPEEFIFSLADRLLAQIPEVMDKQKEGQAGMFERSQETGRINSLSVVLSQEIDRFNRLTRQMRLTLQELQKAIQGVVVMSGELERMLHALLDSQVPDLWSRMAYPCLKPLGSWFKDYLRRIDFLRTWLTAGQPDCFWLPGFFFPQGFLTGVLQMHARKHCIPIDSLAFQFSVTASFEATELSGAPEDGVFIDGLFIDGAQWDCGGKSLTDAAPGVMYSRLPVVHFRPTTVQETPPMHYMCPLYKNSKRAGLLSTTGQSTNFVLYVDLPMKPGSSQDYWVLQGVALLCMLDT